MEQEETGTTCPICRQQIPQGSAYCPHCGTAVSTAATVSKAVSASREHPAKTALVIGGIIVAAALVLFLFIRGILLIVNTAFTSSEPYKTALQLVQQNEDAAWYLGENIERNGMVSGNISVVGQAGSANLTIRVKGSEGSGIVYVIAVKQAGTWTYSTISFYPEGHPDEEVDLLAE